MSKKTSLAARTALASALYQEIATYELRSHKVPRPPYKDLPEEGKEEVMRGVDRMVKHMAELGVVVDVQ